MKENQRLKKIRDCLLQRKKTTWSEIKDATNIQDKQLSYDLKKLMIRGEVETENDMKDRRRTWYKLKGKDKAETEVRRFQVKEFLDSLKEPYSSERTQPISNYDVTVSVFAESGKKITHLDEDVKQMIRNFETLVNLLRKNNLDIFGIFVGAKRRR